MNPELQIMFHVLLFALCGVIALLWSISADLVSHSLKTLGADQYPLPIGLIFLTLIFFIPLEIVFWIFYWIFV